VSDSTADQSRRVAMLAAAAERAQLEGLPFPAPEGAQATGIYKLELAAETGSGGETTTRLALAAVLLLALVAGAVLSRRTAALVAG
jgi:hypothetical protein